MISHLTHLHNQTENVRIIVQHHTSAHVGVELASCVCHDTAREVMLDFSEKFIADSDSAKLESLVSDIAGVKPGVRV